VIEKGVERNIAISILKSDLISSLHRVLDVMYQDEVKGEELDVKGKEIQEDIVISLPKRVWWKEKRDEPFLFSDFIFSNEDETVLIERVASLIGKEENNIIVEGYEEKRKEKGKGYFF